MKTIISTAIIFILIFSSCNKIEPEIADKSDIPFNTYSEQIYAQPIVVDDQIISIINIDGNTYLNSYDKDGNKNWEQNIDSYIIDGQIYAGVDQLKLGLTGSGEITIDQNIYWYWKSVKFNKQGEFIRQLENFVHQPDTIFFDNNQGIADTLTNDTIPDFYANKILSLSNNNTLILSIEKSPLIDSNIVQLSFYDSNGNFIENKYSFLAEIDEQYQLNHIYLTSNDYLALLIDFPSNEKGFTLMNLDGELQLNASSVGSSFNIFSFLEDSKGNFIYTGQTVNTNLTITGLIFCVDPTGQLLWQKTYLPDIASIFLSVQELPDGYLFTGFNSTSIQTILDWRNGFIDEREANSIVLKTDFNGDRVWNSIVQIQQESIFGAVSLYTDKITFFGQKNNNGIINTMFLDIEPTTTPN